MDTPAPIPLTLFSRPGCGLCEEAYEVVTDVRRGLSGQVETMLQVVDITTDSDLLAQYRYDIPVLRVDGEDAFRHRIDPAQLRERLSRGAP